MIRPGNVCVPTVPETFPPVCPRTGLPIRSRPKWVFTSPAHTYRTTFAQIGSNIFWVIPRGYVTEADMQQAVALAAAIKAEALPGDAPFVFIESFEHTTGGTAGARRCYLEFTNTLKGLLGSFPYGMPPFFRLSFNLSRHLRLHRYKVHMVQRYEDAVTKALGMLRDHGVAVRPVNTPAASRQPPARLNATQDLSASDSLTALGSEDALSAQVDGLLAHLGAIDLAKPGIPEDPAITHRGALHPVYEAIGVLKADMDQFLAEHRDLMAILQAHQQALVEKMREIERHNRELQTLMRQSSDDQMELEENALHNIQTLLKPLVRLMKGEVQTPFQRGWIDGLTARIDTLTKELAPRLDWHRYRLTPQEIRVARLIRSGARSGPIADQLGLSVRTVESCRGRLRTKLGIRGRRRNLRTALLAIPEGPSAPEREVLTADRPRMLK
jgi:DNA-binding NarL/FixJ family response regulator